jgi:KipI family sensor histidine kinase inhibitor
MIDLRPLGDRAFLARFPRETDAQNWAEAVRSRAISGVVEVTVAYSSAAVFVDPDRTVWSELSDALRGIEPVEASQSVGRLIRLPVLYDGEDLAEVARLVDLTQPEVIDRHSSCDYTVFAIGFLPGFPYLGYLREPLSGLPRLTSPRLRVPGGSVAIAGRQTGIYPVESPGGWRLLGRTPLRIVDLDRGHFPIRPGDQIRFVPIGPDEYRSRLGEPVGLAE